MNRRLVFISSVFIAMLVFSLGVGSGIVIERRVLAQQQATSSQEPQEFSLIRQAWDLIQEKYVDRSAVQPVPLTYGAISGMVEALGDTGHSTFLSPEMVKVEQNFTQGEFEGIGAEVQMKDGHVVIVAPLDNSPAQKAGLKPGDIILTVDGEDVAGQPLEQVVGKIVGPAGTSVTITVQDPDSGQTRQVTIQRARIELQNVTWQMLPGTTIAHLRIAAFSDGVTKDLQKALQEIKDQGATGLALDLRNDPGGLLSEAIGVTSQFLKEGNVLLEKNAQGDIQPVPVQSGGIATDIPMIVLINGGTASAAEIVSGALQDAGRARLVGETTFGTGTVLNQFPLSDGSALLLATEEWLTPNGRTIWHKGISPDVEVTLPANTIPLTPESERSMTAEQFQASQDTQLIEAAKLLK